LLRLYTRKFPIDQAYTNEQAHELGMISRSISRQIGLMIDRRGRVNMVIVGSAAAIFIPELPSKRIGAERLKGIRLIHTHLSLDLLSQEDLMDLLFLRLDALSVITINPHGEPVQCQHAYLLPPNPLNEAYYLSKAEAWDKHNHNFAEIIQALENELSRIISDGQDSDVKIRTLLVSVSNSPKSIQERNLYELKELAHTAGLNVVGQMIQRKNQHNPKFILGKGKMSELEILALQNQADILIFDNELLPTQLHNVAEITERKVLDRTQLILDIFAQHASTKAGKLQVEMAQLKYMQPRLVGKNRAMDRLMGGVGGRGPGETKLETDRRRVKDKITKLKKELDILREQRYFARARRSRQSIPVVALVGYTNTGKSTLLNTLTKSNILCENKLFATLDPTTRRLRFPHEKEIILSDTVGFIRNLPKELIAAFRATLEELESANLLIHVADASHPDMPNQILSVEKILQEINLTHIPTILVLNKSDKLNINQRAFIADSYPQAIFIAALTSENLGLLLKEIERNILTIKVDANILEEEVKLSQTSILQ